jgi:hypothetical protein
MMTGRAVTQSCSVSPSSASGSSSFLGPHARRTGLASVERDEQAGHGWDSTPNVVVVRHSDSSGEPVCMGQEYDRSEAVDAGDITAGEQIEGRG